MGDASRLRRQTREQRLASRQQRMRLVPSRRGLVTVFLAAAAAGAGLGFTALHFFGHVCR